MMGVYGCGHAMELQEFHQYSILECDSFIQICNLMKFLGVLAAWGLLYRGFRNSKVKWLGLELCLDR